MVGLEPEADGPIKQGVKTFLFVSDGETDYCREPGE